MWVVLLLAPVLVLLLLLARLACVLLLGRRPLPLRNGSPVRTMIVLGSGGHTAEMLMLVEQLDKVSYAPRCYVVAETDKMSAAKALSHEKAWAAAAAAHGSGAGGGKAQQQPTAQQGPITAPSSSRSKENVVSVAFIPRSREVGQSYISSVGTTLYSLLFAAWTVLRRRPHVVLANGPGTCIPVCAAAFLYRLLLFWDVRVVYVESIARVRKLSLSGQILYSSRMADVVFVQWPELQARYPRSVHAGRLY